MHSVAPARTASAERRRLALAARRSSRGMNTMPMALAYQFTNGTRSISCLSRKCSGTGTARNSAQMSITDWWLATSTYGFDQSTRSCPSTCTRAPAPPSKPGAQSQDAMRRGRRLRPPVTAHTSSARVMQAMVQARVKANWTRLSTLQPRRGNMDLAGIGSTCWFTGNPWRRRYRRRMMHQRCLQAKRRSAQLVAPERRAQRPQPPQETGETGIASREAALAQLELGDEERRDDPVVEQVGEPRPLGAGDGDRGLPPELGQQAVGGGDHRQRQVDRPQHQQQQRPAQGHAARIAPHRRLQVLDGSVVEDDDEAVVQRQATVPRGAH